MLADTLVLMRWSGDYFALTGWGYVSLWLAAIALYEIVHGWK